MKTLILLLIFLILLFWGIKKYIIWSVNFCAKEDEFYHDVLSFIWEEQIPIIKSILALGMLPTESRNKVMPKENQKIYSDIYYGRKLWRIKNPKDLYELFKKELCGDLPIKWKQALKEANTLRLENLNK